MDKAKLLLYKLNLGNLGVIYAPITEDVLQMEEKKFWEIVNPFGIDFDTFDIKKEEVEKEGLKRLDIFTSLQGNELCNSLINSLKYFYKTDNIALVNKAILIDCKDIGKVIQINKDNFDELCEIILRLCNVEKVKEEKKREVTIQNEENRAILEEYLRLQEQAKKEQEQMNKNNKITLLEMVTVVASDCNWDWDKVLQMTYFRLLNTYRNVMTRDVNNISLIVNCSNKFETKEGWHPNHWTESIKKDL